MVKSKTRVFVHGGGGRERKKKKSSDCQTNKWGMSSAQLSSLGISAWERDGGWAQSRLITGLQAAWGCALSLTESPN